MASAIVVQAASEIFSAARSQSPEAHFGSTRRQNLQPCVSVLRSLSAEQNPLTKSHLLQTSFKATTGHNLVHKKRKRSLDYPRSSSQWEAPVASASSPEYRALEGINVYKATTGKPVPLLSLWDGPSGSSALLAFLTHFADLSSWEYAQKITQKVLPALPLNGSLPLVAIGLGSVENARKFSQVLKFPLDILYADPDGECYNALNFSKGFGANVSVSPYLKLLPMLMGVGSPGTIQEVLRGYVGDRSSKPVFSQPTPFDILGTGYQRPFELATLRLFNMAGILPKWGDLCPPKTDLLTQQGGTILFRGTETVYKHADSGILKYTDVEALLEAAANVVEGGKLVA